MEITLRCWAIIFGLFALAFLGIIILGVVSLSGIIDDLEPATQVEYVGIVIVIALSFVAGILSMAFVRIFGK